MKELFKDIGKGMYDLYCSPHELAAIWLNMPINTDKGITCRLAPNALIRYDEGHISVTRDDFNYKVLVCYGTLIDQFKIKVLNLITGTEEMIAI